MILSMLTGAALAGAPMPPRPERAMLAEVQRLYRGAGDRLWPGFGEVPLDLMLIGADRETLFCHAAVKGFTAAGRDPLTKCHLQVRPRRLSPDLAAAYPVFPGGESIAIGYPATLEMSPAYWKATILHEAFHLYQSHLPGYAQAVQAVGRSLRSSDGGWVLNYPFPYADPKVGEAFLAMGEAGLAFLTAPSTEQRHAARKAYVAARETALARVSADDRLYYEFQVGQEGVARWTELTLARRGDAAMRADALDRWTGLATSLRAIREQGFKTWKRGALYVYGAIEAEMLERSGVDWRQAYRHQPFALGEQLRRLD